ncbi:DUF806 family protein [Secundilactobacillus kimchicus]|uniref:DUF806 family protein n=1 Tax=Secundilactobacillus kimchicus TaxID=528209 RepID=UPI0024A7A8F5|nr:DUF806 family protein [Secundilactobacillus kimchicus]
MTIAARLKTVLDVVSGVDPSHIYTYNIDEQDRTYSGPVFLITEIQAVDDGFGNDDPVTSTKQVQLEIYYPRDYIQNDMDSFEFEIVSALRKRGFRCFANPGRIVSPDNLQLVATYKFNYGDVNV